MTRLSLFITVPMYLGFLGLCCVALPSSMAAVEAAPPDPATITLDILHATNAARTDLARATANWDLERQRLQALVDATRAETARLEREAAAAEATRDAARQRLAALGTASDLETIKDHLARAGKELLTGLTALADTATPGTIPTAGPASGDDSDFDQGVRRLEAAERAAAMVAVDVVSGQRAGTAQAVKLLRVAGAAAWWVSLDGTAAGTARLVNGQVVLDLAGEPERAAIIAALAQAEGHAQPAVVLLPAPGSAEAK